MTGSLSTARNENLKIKMNFPASLSNICYCSRCNYGDDSFATNFQAVLYGVDEIGISSFPGPSWKKDVADRGLLLCKRNGDR